MVEKNITDSALGLLKARQWAGPESNSSFERFLMEQSAQRKRRGNSRWVIGTLVLGVALSAAAAAGVYHRWVTLRGSDGSQQGMVAIDNEDGTLTLVDKDGNTQTAHLLAPRDGRWKATLTNGEAAEFDTLVEDGETMFAKVGGTVVDENGEEIAVTHDLSGDGPAPVFQLVPLMLDPGQE